MMTISPCFAACKLLPPLTVIGGIFLISRICSAISFPRDSSLDPINICSPAIANRNASPCPSGPVPPIIEIILI